MVEVSQNKPISNITTVSEKRINSLETPGKIPSQEVYSFKKGQQLHHQIQQDVYEGEKKAKRPKRKFPTILKILGAITGISALLIFRKNILNYIKGIFKKTPAPPTTP